MVTDMSSTDCLMNPAGCAKGLSLGMTVKFDKSVNDYKEPRYLLDTGAQSLQTRGVSFYVKDGKVFFTLAISQKSWEVRTNNNGRDGKCLSRFILDVNKTQVRQLIK